MGTNFKKAIFDEQMQARLVGWVQKAKKKGLKGDNNGQSIQGSAQVGVEIQMEPVPEENVIVPRDEGHE